MVRVRKCLVQALPRILPLFTPISPRFARFILKY